MIGWKRPKLLLTMQATTQLILVVHDEAAIYEAIKTKLENYNYIWENLQTLDQIESELSGVETAVIPDIRRSRYFKNSLYAGFLFSSQ